MCSVILIAATTLSACDQINDLSRPRLEDDDIAAYVDDQPITNAQVVLEAQAQALIEPGQTAVRGSAGYISVVNQLVDQYLLAREAETHLLHADPQSRHRLAMARQRILGNLLLETLIARNIDEATVISTYESQRELMHLGQEVRMRHIVLKSRGRAEKILAELNNGADFAILAANHSIDAPTRLEGGDLGYLTVENAPAALRPILRRTAIGEAAGPIETDLGWHVIRIEDRRQEMPPTLEELRPQIMQFLALAEIDKELRRLRAQAHIRVLAEEQGLTDPFELADEEDNESLSYDQ